MTRTLHALVALFVAVIALSCGSGSPPVDPPPPRATSVAGVWERQLPSGEVFRLSLFASGIMGFQHLGADVPISRSYGKWTYSAGALDLTAVGSEPDGHAFPLASPLAAKVEASTLVLESARERSVWTTVAHPYGTASGVEERAAQDEQSWTSLVQRAEQNAAAARP